MQLFQTYEILFHFELYKMSLMVYMYRIVESQLSSFPHSNHDLFLQFQSVKVPVVKTKSRRWSW